MANFQDQLPPLTVENTFHVFGLMKTWADKGAKDKAAREGLVEKAKQTDMSPGALAALFGVKTPAEAVDEILLDRLILRRSIYGDICQNETEDSIKDILVASGNSVVIATKVMKLKANVEGQSKVQPPAFYEDGNVFVKPKIQHIPV